MKNRYEVRLSGDGGQGLITAGMIIGEAISVFDNKTVVQTQSYGPEARGGACKAEIVIAKDNSPINYPKAIKPDLLLALSQQAYDKYIDEVQQDGIVIVDSSLVKYKKGKGIYPVPITQLAIEKVGIKVVANVIALGIISSLTGIVSYQALERALLSRIPPGTEEINKKALKIGETINFKDDI